MEEKRQGHGRAASRVEADRDAQVTINWDNADFRTIRSDFFRVSAKQEEISLLFAPDKPLHPDDQEVITIPFSTRIVLSPFLAKQFAIHLNRAVTEYDPKSPSSAPPAAKSPARRTTFKPSRLPCSWIATRFRAAGNSRRWRNAFSRGLACAPTSPKWVR